VTLSVTWPEPAEIDAQLIPQLSQRIDVEIVDPATEEVLVSDSIQRPAAAPWTVQKTYEGVRASSDAVLTATAYPNASETAGEIAQAAGSMHIVIPANATAYPLSGQAGDPINLVLGSTVTEVEVTVTPPTVPAGGTAQATATALNADNETVLVPGFDWSTSNSNISVEQNGRVTGEIVGTGDVIATETESGISGSASVTVVSPEATAPTVSSTVPADGASSVAINTKVSATFSETMNPSTVNNSTFTLEQGGTPVPGTVTYSGTTATFAPATPLGPSTTYTGTITTGAEDLAGNGLESDYVWTFTTGALLDTTPPTVTSTSPANGATNVAINTKVSATFSEAMDPSTVTNSTFTLEQGGTPVAGAVTYAGTTATFAPASPLASATTYTATITTGAEDLAGNALESDYVWSFTTGALLDTTPPTVTSTSPVNGATNVAIYARVSATFSEAMNSSTVTDSTFTLERGGTPVSGTVAIAGTTATFTPSSPLESATEYTATITTGAEDLAGNALESDHVWSFTTADSIAPTVTSTNPADGATNVASDTDITATFSEAMNPTTVTSSTFTLEQGGTPVPGNVTYAGTTATFAPNSPLESATEYTATITTGAEDLAGNGLESDHVWSFTTSDSIAPTVTSTNPADGATNVADDTDITATFSEAMDPTTITDLTFTLEQGGTPVPGTVTYAGTTATFAPDNPLESATVYTATITIGAEDLAGNALESDHVWSFTTADSIAPTVTSTDPLDGATSVSVSKEITATFSEAMDPSTISDLTFTLEQGGTPVSGSVTYAGTTATFAPDNPLASTTTYTATITTVAEDLAGNALESDYVWSFTTGQAPISLGSAGNFAILAGSTVTSTGLSVVNGDLGLSPGTGLTGFPPGVVNGVIHLADAIAADAKSDLTAAANDAAGRAGAVINIPTGELGGLTLTPGLYRSGISSFAITSVDLTLDAQGDPDAVFIFQMPSSTLTVGNGRQVILSGGADPANIFWQVGSSATLGTTSVFKGNILAAASITMQTGARLDGRALTQTAAVTLDASTINRPPQVAGASAGWLSSATRIVQAAATWVASWDPWGWLL
jgi:methionine-rich copper-binding protein CopC